MTELRLGADWSDFPARTICIILFILELRLTKLGGMSRERDPLAKYNFVRKTCGKSSHRELSISLDKYSNKELIILSFLIKF